MSKEESLPDWVTIKCKTDETLYVGETFKTAGLYGDPEWDVMIKCVVCSDSNGNVTNFQLAQLKITFHFLN